MRSVCNCSEKTGQFVHRLRDNDGADVRGPRQYLFQCAGHAKCVPNVNSVNCRWSPEYPAVDLVGKQVQERLDFGGVEYARLHAPERQRLGVKGAHVDWEQAILGVYGHDDHTAGTTWCHGEDCVIKRAFIPCTVEQYINLVVKALFCNCIAYGRIGRELDGRQVRWW